MAARKTARAVAVALLGLTAAAVLVTPATVIAATPWAIDLSPTVLTQGVATDVTVTVTAGNKQLGCVALDIPAGFTVVSTRVSSVPAGLVWSSAGAGAGPTQVTFGTTQDPWRLNQGDQGVLIVRVVATTSPLPAWSASAYQKFTTNPSQLVSGPLQPPVPLLIVPASTPAPTRSATPRPTPTSTLAQTPRPTALPTVIPPGTTPLPTVTPPPSTTPNQSPSDSTIPSEAPSAFSSPGGVIAGGETKSGVGTSGSATGGGDGTSLDVRVLPDGGTVQLDVLALGAVGMFAWLVPGLALSLPGLLLILIVLAQASLGAAFVPVTRRVFGGRRRRRGHGHPTAPA
jgi:hypothetical protein